MRHSCRKRRSFTLVEVMVVIGIIVILVAMTISVASVVFKKAKATQTRQVMGTLAEAVEAFKSATRYFPLAVPNDAWDSVATWQDFVQDMGWRALPDLRWADYFQSSNVIPDNGRPDTTGAAPTNIHMLVFQLEQVPESNSIVSKLKETVKVETTKLFDGADAADMCELTHPLDGSSRKVYQPQDAWGTPLRYWTSDILRWAKSNSGGDWEDAIQKHLATKLQEANWGFFIESAGPDETFGWWGGVVDPDMDKQVADNLFSISAN